MLVTDDIDLSYLLVQASALFDHNECPNMELEQMQGIFTITIGSTF